MQGAARIFEAGRPQALVEMEGGLMLVKAISDGSSLAVLAAPECDTDLVPTSDAAGRGGRRGPDAGGPRSSSILSERLALAIVSALPRRL